MWNKAIKNFVVIWSALPKQNISLQIFQRLSSTNFTWSILENIVLYMNKDKTVAYVHVFAWKSHQMLAKKNILKLFQHNLCKMFACKYTLSSDMQTSPLLSLPIRVFRHICKINFQLRSKKLLTNQIHP